MTKQTIEAEGLPEGCKAIDYRVPKDGESYFYDRKIYSDRAQTSEYLIVEKIQMRRIVLEFTNEKRKLRARDYFIDERGFLGQWRNLGSSGDEYTILREVKETDIPLTNAEPKLSLSVDECKALFTGNWELIKKIIEFIKDK